MLHIIEVSFIILTGRKKEDGSVSLPIHLLHFFLAVNRLSVTPYPNPFTGKVSSKSNHRLQVMLNWNYMMALAKNFKLFTRGTYLQEVNKQ